MHAVALWLLLNATSIPVSLQHLQLDLTVDYAAERIDGVARLTIRNVTDAPVTTVPLLLNRLMTIKRATGDDGTALGLEQEVVLFSDDSTYQVDAANITLRAPLAPGKTTTIALEYGGHLVGYVETGSLYIKDHIDEEFTVIREDAWAFPGVGVPSRRLNRAGPRENFTFDIHVDVPAGLVVAAGGLFAGTQDANGRTTFHYRTEIPAPFVNIAVAKYKMLESAGVRVDYFGADEAGAKTVMDRALKALQLYEGWFGPLPQPPRFSIIEIPDGYGAQASLVAGIILESPVFHDPQYLGAMYHEIGHFWNVPDKDVPSSRWNEGLSTWLQVIVPEVLDQKPDPRFDGRVFDRTQKRIAKDARLTRVPLKDYGKEEMTDNAYGIGYLYLRVIERVIGREQLLGVLHDYFQTHKVNGGTLLAFTTMLELRYPATRRIDADWIETAAWTGKLTNAKSLEEVVAVYKASNAGTPR
jgi:aminopeptidase N